MIGQICISSVKFRLKPHLALCFVVFIALCSFQNISAQDRCATAMDIGTGQCLTLFNGPATSDEGTGQFCEMDYDNNLWYTFVAEERITTVSVIPTYCVNGQGLEMEIFQSPIPCAFFDVPLACGSGMGDLPFSFTVATEPGEVYYIIIDGVRGDICDFMMHLIHGECPAQPRACDSIASPILIGQDSICFGQGVFIYEVTNYDPSLTYKWHIPDLNSYTDLGNGRIEIDFGSDWQGTGNPMICVAAYDINCLYKKTCLSVVNTDVGVALDPQSIRRCPHSFPIRLSDYFVILFINQLVSIPDDLRVHYYLSQEDLLNDENEVVTIDSVGDHTIFVAFSRGDCLKTPRPSDSAHILTEFLDLQVETQEFCYGEVFDFDAHVQVTELNGYPGFPFDSLRYFTNASDAAGNRNRIDLPYQITEEGTYWARFNTNNGCNDTISFDVNFHEIPEFTAISPDTICSVLGNATYNLLSTPFDFSVGDIGDMTFSFFRSETGAINNVGESGAIVNASRTYYAVATSPYGCRSEPVPITVVFQISPYIEIFGDGELCAGDSGEIVITTVNSPVPFTLEIEDEHGNNYVIYSFTPSLFYYIPIYETSEFELIRFETDEFVFCPYEYNMNVAFEVIRLPLAALEVATGCGSETGVYFRASQDGEYNVHIHNENTGASYVFTGELNNEFLSIPVVDGDVLVLDSFQYDNECWSFEADTTEEIIVQQPLEINNISIGACDPLQSTISFVISGGDESSYQVVGVPGTIQPNGTDFVSDPLSTGSYDIIVFDGRECDTVQLNIMIDCGCLTEAGTISQMDTILCVDDVFNVSTISDTVLVSGDLIHFILHDQPIPAFGNILISNVDGVFSFDPGTMVIGDPYYVTMWVGPELNGEVDTTAFCAVHSNTLEITWVEPPAMTIFDSLLLCTSPIDTFVIVNFSGSGPYSFSYQYGSTLIGPITTNLSSIVLNLNGLDLNTTLQIIDFENEACAGTVSGEGEILFLENPEFRNLIYTCLPSKDSFNFQVELVGGTPPYSLTGISGTVIGNIFYSDNLPSGYNGLLQLTDQNGCDVIDLSITRDCECESSPSILPADDLHLCADSIVVLTAVINPIIAVGDGERFFIKDNNLLDASGILNVLSSPRIAFDPAYMVFDQTYFIMPATGLLDLGGDIILDHKCFMPSAPVAFTFYDAPSIDIFRVGDTLNCNISQLTLDASGSYLPPGYVFEWSTTNGQIISGEFTLQPIVDFEGNYFLRIYHPLAGCEELEEIIIFRDENVPIANIVGDTLLNCDMSSLILDGQLSSTGSNIQYQWQTPDGNIISGTDQITAEINQDGTYQLIVIDEVNACRDTATISVSENFTRPDLSVIYATLELICDVSYVNMRVDTSLLTLNDEITWTSDTEPITLLSPSEIAIYTPGIYRVTVENVLSGCIETEEFTITEDRINPELLLPNPYYVDCLNNLADLEVEITNMGGAAYGFLWTTTNGTIIGDRFAQQIQADDEGIFRVEVTNLHNGCVSIVQTEVIALQEPIRDVELLVDPSPCGTPDNGMIQLNSIVGGTGPFTILLDGQTYTMVPLSISDLNAGNHTLEIIDENQCRFDTTFSIINLENVEVELPPSVTVDEGESVHIVPSYQGTVDTFIWIKNDTGMLALNSLDPTLFPEDDFVLKIIVVSPDGCEAEDVMQIYVRKFYNIYIPNAFSPNDDGVNDFLTVLGPEKLEFVERFQIFDRWGGKVFERFDFAPNDESFGWDGTFNEQLSPAGVYVYALSAIFKDGTPKELSGDIILTR